MGSTAKFNSCQYFRYTVYYKSQGERGEANIQQGGNLPSPPKCSPALMFLYMYLHQRLGHLSNDIEDAIFLSRIPFSIEDLVAEPHHWIERVLSLLTGSGKKGLGGYHRRYQIFKDVWKKGRPRERERGGGGSGKERERGANFVWLFFHVKLFTGK